MNGDTGNVVRLPRDWLGPRDELIPFGPSARRAEAAATRAAAEADILELGPRDLVAEPLDCTQDDFWGGHLEAIPKPMVGPRPQEAESSPDLVDPGSPCEPAGVGDPDGVGSTSQSPYGPTLGSDSEDPGARVATPGRTRPRPHHRATRRDRAMRHHRATLSLARPRIRVPAVAGSLAAAALVATVVVSLPGSGARIAVHHPGPALASAASSLVLPDTLDPHPRRVARAACPAGRSLQSRDQGASHVSHRPPRPPRSSRSRRQARRRPPRRRPRTTRSSSTVASPPVTHAGSYDPPPPPPPRSARPRRVPSARARPSDPANSVDLQQNSDNTATQVQILAGTPRAAQ